MRQPNPVDFWRGYALASIFVNHIPGIALERLTHRHFSFSDSAELFVFLAGYGLRSAMNGKGQEMTKRAIIGRFFGRALFFYAAQMVMVIIALALIAGASVYYSNPALLDWNNAGPIFDDPVRGHIGVALLLHNMRYLDIMPLYICLMLMAPFIVFLEWLSWQTVLLVSFALYVLALVFRINIPTWPVEGEWFFDPLSWQFLFVCGFLVAGKMGAQLRDYAGDLRPFAILITLTSAGIVMFHLAPDPVAINSGMLSYLFAKTYLGPVRVLQFFALVITMAPLFRMIAAHLPIMAQTCSMMGRNSLIVFCLASLLSIIGQILRFAAGHTLIFDGLIVVGGIGLLLSTAWVSEWRYRKKRSTGMQSQIFSLA